MPVISAIRGCSSVGRAPALQAGGHEFESHHLHSDAKASVQNLENCIKNKIKNNSSYRSSDRNEEKVQTSVLIIVSTMKETNRESLTGGTLPAIK